MRKQNIVLAVSTAALFMFSPLAKAEGLFFGTCLSEDDQPTTNLPEFIACGESHSEGHSAVPIQRLDSAKIESASITDISDAMRRFAGVVLRDYGGEGSMKTISLRGLGAHHTGVSYDGVNVSDAQTGQVDISRYSPSDLAEISVISGETDNIFIPARMSASSAMLMLSTPEVIPGRDKNYHLKSAVRTGSFGYISPSILFAKRIGESLSFSTLGEYTHSDNNYPFTIYNGPYKETEKRKNASFDGGHGEINVSYLFHNKSKLNGKAYFYAKNQNLPGPVIYYSPDNNESLKERDTFGQLHYLNRVAQKWQYMASAKYQWSKTDYRDINGIYPEGMLQSRYIRREGYASATGMYIPTDNLRMSYSIDYSYNNLTDIRKAESKPYRHTSLQNFSIKWQTNMLTFTAKALLSIYKDINKSEAVSKMSKRLSPSLSIMLKPISSFPFRIRASYKNIFRMPTFSELYFDHYGSVNLDPEITEQFNIGSSAELSFSRLSANLSVDGYLNFVKNKIVAMPYNMFVMTMTNLGKVRIIGADFKLDAEYRISRSHTLTFAGCYSYQRSAVRTSPDRIDWNCQTAYTPLNSGAGSASWENPWVSIGVHFTACSSRYTSNTGAYSNRISGFMESGFSCWHTFTFKGQSLKLRGDIINAFNKQYEFVYRYPMPGRSWKITIEYNI